MFYGFSQFYIDEDLCILDRRSEKKKKEISKNLK